MSSSSLMRWAGLAALVSGVVSVIGDLLRLFVDVENPQTATTVPYTFVFLLYLLSTALLLLGLIGLCVSQSEETGVLGLAGFLAAFLGTVLLAGALWFELFITPALAARAPELAEAELGLAGFILVFLFGALGWILFGVATLRARVYPRWAAVLLMVGGCSPSSLYHCRVSSSLWPWRGWASSSTWEGVPEPGNPSAWARSPRLTRRFLV